MTSDEAVEVGVLQSIVQTVEVDVRGLKENVNTNENSLISFY